MNKKKITLCPARQAIALACATLATAATANGDLTTFSLEQLMAIKVMGASKYEQSQQQVAAAVRVLTREDIREFGWRTLDEALASLPGVFVTYDRQYVYLGARGFGVPGDFNTRLLVTINGNRVNDAMYDAGPMGRQFPLDLDVVEQIEFIPGPGGAIHGQNALFGVINVVTLEGSGLGGAEGAARVQAPQRAREGRASWGGTLDNGVDLLLSATAYRMRGWDPWIEFGEAGVAGRATGLDGERSQQLFVRAARNAWSADLVYGSWRKDDPTASYFSDPLVPGQYQQDGYLLAQVQYQRRHAPQSIELHARVFTGRERYDSTLTYGTDFSYPAESKWIGSEVRAVMSSFTNHKLLLGAEVQRNYRVDQHILDRAAPANDLVISSPGWRAGVYVQDEWRISGTLGATLGMRLDRTDTVGTVSSPRAALIWQASDATTLKALTGRAHRAPNAYERDYEDGLAQVANPSLSRETVDTVEFVADHRLAADLGLRASVYRWSMRNLVTMGLDPDGVPQYQSGPPVRAHGLELSADKTWGWGGRLRANASFQHLEHADGRSPVNSPRALARLDFSTPVAGTGVRAAYELRYDGRRRTRSGASTPGFAVSNLRVSSDRGDARGFDWGAGVRNLFDRSYWHPAADSNWQDALEQDGRSVYVEAHFRF